jgi:fructose-bisphosphate aldolase class I
MKKLGIPQTEEACGAYRELFVTTPVSVSALVGVILYDETIRQQKKDGSPFVKAITEAGIIPGGRPVRHAIASTCQVLT